MGKNVFFSVFASLVPTNACGSRPLRLGWSQQMVRDCNKMFVKTVKEETTTDVATLGNRWIHLRGRRGDKL